MAIKAGMTIAQAIAQLTKGFVKVMKRQPEALEKIKIKQEATEKLKDLNKVVDMEGKVIDPSKGIIGGKQFKAMGGRIGFEAGTPEHFRKYLEEREMIEKRQRLEQLLKEYEDDMNRKKVMQQKQEAADGGRIGLKTGMSRRAFLKLMGAAGAGIGALKTGILKLASKEGARQVTKQIIKTDPVPGKPADRDWETSF